MKDFESQYYEVLKLPKTPYNFSGTGIKARQAGTLMPMWPPQYQVKSESGSEDEETNYIDRAKELYAKRRGILKNTLDLS